MSEDLILQINDQLSIFDASHSFLLRPVSSESEYINEDSDNAYETDPTQDLLHQDWFN